MMSGQGEDAWERAGSAVPRKPQECPPDPRPSVVQLRALWTSGSPGNTRAFRKSSGSETWVLG